MTHTKKINLNALRLAESAARNLSFTKAGDEHLISASAVSQRIKNLEQELGFNIFKRKGNIISTTIEGATYIAAVRQTLDRLNAIGEKLNTQNNQSTISLSIPGNFATKWLLPRLNSYQSSFPETVFRLSVDEVPHNFLDSGNNCAIVFSGKQPRKFFGSSLLVEDLVPVCTPATAKRIVAIRGKKRPHLSRLADVNLIECEQYQANWDNWLEAVKAPKKLLKEGRWLFDNKQTCIDAAKNNLGVALLDRKTVTLALTSRTLVAPFDYQEKLKFGLDNEHQSLHQSNIQP